MKSEATLRRYALPSQQGEGWAIIVIGSDGYFSTVSDYGNYAFIWGHHGCKDFRQFLLRADRDWDYFVNKLSPMPGGRKHDAEATEKGIKKFICEQRRSGDLMMLEAREEWDLLDQLEVGYSEFGFQRWCLETSFAEAWEFSREMYDPQCKAFVQKVLAARLGPVLRAELEAEGLEAA